MSNEADNQKSRAGAAGKMRTEVELLSHQLRSSVPSCLGHDLRQSLIQGTLNFYDGFKAKDRMETLLIRHIVILNNLATECLQRGMNSSKPEARAVDLRSGLKAVSLMAELTKLLECRRARGQQTSSAVAGAENVNLESIVERAPTTQATDEVAEPWCKTKSEAA